ncbi:MAG: hypothetical protein ACTSQO_04345 [Candidatus Helarchaeota archaeon]
MLKFRIYLISLIIVLFIGMIQINIAGNFRIWGVNLDDSNLYILSETYSGSVNSINDLPLQTYKIIGINDYNSDLNHYNDIYMQFQTKKSGQIYRDFIYLYDDFAYNRTDYLYNVTYKIDGLIYIRCLLPISENKTSKQGFNWTRAAIELGKTKGFNLTKVFNILTINCDTGKFYDEKLKANYTMKGIIQWDEYTGWIIFYDIIKEYGNPLNYSYRLKISIFSSSSVFYINWTYVFNYICIAIGVGGVILFFLSMNKSKYNKKEE